MSWRVTDYIQYSTILFIAWSMTANTKYTKREKYESVTQLTGNVKICSK